MVVTQRGASTLRSANTCRCLKTPTAARPAASRPFSSAAASTRQSPAAQRSSWSSWSRSWVKELNGNASQRRSFHASRGLRAGKDPYGVLGVAKDAKTSDIKKAYYQLAKKFHPDSNKEKTAKEKFVEIQEAYDTLSDDKKRADFDRWGSASQQQGFDSDAYSRATSGFGGGGGFGDFFNQGGAGGAQGSDIFESLFGAFGGRGGQARQGQSQPVGEDIEVAISLPFVDAAKGTIRTVNITPVVDCKTCHGSGLKEGAKKAACRVCNGTGTRTFTIQSGFQMASTCNACGGAGQVAPEGSGCGSCAGVGKVRERATVEVKVPPGVDNGMKIRIDGKGDAPIGGGKGRVGDLYVRVNVLPSKIFTRQGSNLYEDVAVPFYTAILGGRARVATLDKEVEVKVPNGTQPGEEMVLRGRGVKKLYKEEYGDLVVKFNVTMPRSLTPAQRRILQQFVSETEFPGSAAYAPTTPRAPDTPPTTPPPSPSPSSASPGFESQAKPPPSSRDTSMPFPPLHLTVSTPTDLVKPPGDAKKWWANMDKEADLSEPFTPPPSPKATPAASSSSAAPPPPSPSSEPKAAPEEPKEPQDDSLLGNAWKGLRSWLPKK